MATWWTVPRCWPGATVFCLATGPSLTAAQVDAVRGRGPVIAISDAFRMAPWADVLYSCDLKWWQHHWHRGAAAFAGLKVTIDDSVPYPDVLVLRNTSRAGGRIVQGFDPDPGALRDGSNSGYQAIHLAAHTGCRRIILLGYDMGTRKGQPSHFFGDHPEGLQMPTPYERIRGLMHALVAPLEALGIQVINCTPGSLLDCWPKVPLEAALAQIGSDAA